MREVTRTVYLFDELSDKAKETARDWFREGVGTDDWYEAIYEDAAKIGEILGIKFKQRPVQTVGGTTRYEPAILFTGFSSQGDGACFEGSYSYAKGCAVALKAYAPQDEKLAQIAADLVALQKANGYKLTATVKHSGHYYHSGSTDIEVCKGDDYAPADLEQELKDILRRFMDWIYRLLESEYEYLISEESVDENIRCNEYEFEEDGRRTRF